MERVRNFGKGCKIWKGSEIWVRVLNSGKGWKIGLGLENWKGSEIWVRVGNFGKGWKGISICMGFHPKWLRSPVLD